MLGTRFERYKGVCVCIYILLESLPSTVCQPPSLFLPQPFPSLVLLVMMLLLYTIVPVFAACFLIWMYHNQLSIFELLGWMPFFFRFQTLWWTSLCIHLWQFRNCFFRINSLRNKISGQRMQTLKKGSCHAIANVRWDGPLIPSLVPVAPIVVWQISLCFGVMICFHVCLLYRSWGSPGTTCCHVWPAPGLIGLALSRHSVSVWEERLMEWMNAWVLVFPS